MPYDDHDPAYGCGCLVAIAVSVAFWALLVFVIWWMIYR